MSNFDAPMTDIEVSQFLAELKQALVEAPDIRPIILEMVEAGEALAAAA